MKVFFNWTTVSSSILELYLIKLWVTANPKCPHDDKAQGLLNQGYVGILVYERTLFSKECSPSGEKKTMMQLQVTVITQFRLTSFLPR